MRAANPAGASATRLAASRFVRLDTGSSRLAVLASQTVAIARDSAVMPARRAVASITGVRSTAVVSRFSVAVVSDANRTQSRNSAR